MRACVRALKEPREQELARTAFADRGRRQARGRAHHGAAGKQLPDRIANQRCHPFPRYQRAGHAFEGRATPNELNSAVMNRLIYGGNLLAMAALLAGDVGTPSMRGKVDLIYIDLPFDSKADYRAKITLSGGDIE